MFTFTVTQDVKIYCLTHPPLRPFGNDSDLEATCKSRAANEISHCVFFGERFVLWLPESKLCELCCFLLFYFLYRIQKLDRNRSAFIQFLSHGRTQDARPSATFQTSLCSINPNRCRAAASHHSAVSRKASIRQVKSRLGRSLTRLFSRLSQGHTCSVGEIWRDGHRWSKGGGRIWYYQRVCVLS